MLVAYSQRAARQRHRHMAGLRWPHLWCDAVRECRKTWMHRSMALCLVTHNTGIAQSPSDPVMCDTGWSQFSALFMQGRTRRKCAKPKHFATHFGGRNGYLQTYPFKFEEQHLRKTDSESFISFLCASLLCLSASSSIHRLDDAVLLDNKMQQYCDC